MTIYPSVLILGSRFDFSCDYVISCLLRRNSSYLRLNSEDLHHYAITLDPVNRELSCTLGGNLYLLTQDTLKSVWFRRAIYPRDYGTSIPPDIDGQIARVQWAAFMRSLMIFCRARWVNHPNATYFAEQKAVQLATASDLGFVVPTTLFTNDARACAALSEHKLVMKGIDTVIAYQDNREYFAFVEPFDPKVLETADFGAIPVTIQEAIKPKVDLRVTVVGNLAFAVEIKMNGTGISGDWRKHKQFLTYTKFILPQSIERKCIALTAKLGLLFGGIDLARIEDTYFFFEINPTGEWSWLVDSAGLPIDEAIADVLLQ
jgi:hypothetical protein